MLSAPALQGTAAGVNTSLSPCPGGVRTSEAAILPYVPYPTCPATHSPPASCLPVLQSRRTSQLGALMTDPTTGIEVPVLAVTLHPQTRQWLTLGGTYCNPLTKTLAPLELGGPMEDPVTGGISPILGVGLDENTGLLAALAAILLPLLPTWPGFPILSSQPPRPSTFWSGLQTPPQARISTLHPPSPSDPHLSSPSQFPSPFAIFGVPQGRREQSCFCSKNIGMFFHQEGHSLLLPPACTTRAPALSLTPSPALPLQPPRVPCHSLCPGPWLSRASSAYIPSPLLPGQVLALGGLRDTSGTLMLPGDSFVEPLSRKPVWLQGASRQEGQTVPHTGGSQALLDANVLVAQRRVIAVLRRSQERPGRHVQGLLETAIKDMRQALALSLHHLLQQARRLQRQREAAESMEADGGRIGTC